MADRTNVIPVFLEEMVASITVTHNLLLAGPTLIQSYSLVDTMAYYWMPEFDSAGKEKLDVHKTDFEDWADRYLLAKQNLLSCTATELYAARCSWLHTHGFEAKINRDNKGRMILYATGNKTAAELQALWDPFAKSGKAPAVVIVSVDDLIRQILKSVRWCWLDIINDGNHYRLYEKRMQKGLGGSMVQDSKTGDVSHGVTFLGGAFEKRTESVQPAVARVRKWLRGPLYDAPPPIWFPG